MTRRGVARRRCRTAASYGQRADSDSVTQPDQVDLLAHYRLRQHCSGYDFRPDILHLFRPDRNSVHADSDRRPGHVDGVGRVGAVPAHPPTIQLGQVASRSNVRQEIRKVAVGHLGRAAADRLHRHRRRHLHDLGGLELSRVVLFLLHHHDDHRIRRFGTRFALTSLTLIR